MWIPEFLMVYKIRGGGGEMTGWELDRGGGKRPGGKSPVGKRRGGGRPGGGTAWYPWVRVCGGP